jgi:hypothetical protein
MERTDPGDVLVTDRLRTGGLTRLMTDGFRPWQ